VSDPGYSSCRARARRCWPDWLLPEPVRPHRVRGGCRRTPERQFGSLWKREGFLSVTFDSLWLTNHTDPKRVRVRTSIRISEARHEQHNGVPPLPGLVRRRCQSVSQLWQMDPSAGLLPDDSTGRARPLVRDHADRRTPVVSQSSLHLVPRRNTDALLVGRLDDQASFLGLSARLLRRLDRPG
jgi:hypothetical protein